LQVPLPLKCPNPSLSARISGLSFYFTIESNRDLHCMFARFLHSLEFKCLYKSNRDLNSGGITGQATSGRANHLCRMRATPS